MVVLRRSTMVEGAPGGLTDRASGALSRLAAGILIKGYAAGGRPSWRGRLGLSLAVLPVARSATAAVGVELTIDVPVAEHIRVGARGSVEGGDDINLYTVGSRIQLASQLSIAVDLYTLEAKSLFGVDQEAGEVGMMFGLALTGDLSRYVAIPIVALTSFLTSRIMSAP